MDLYHKRESSALLCPEFVSGGGLIELSVIFGFLGFRKNTLFTLYKSSSIVTPAVTKTKNMPMHLQLLLLPCHTIPISNVMEKKKVFT